MLAIFEHFREAKVLSIIQAFFWYFSRKNFFSENIKIRVIFPAKTYFRENEDKLEI